MSAFYLAGQHLRFHRMRAALLVLALGLTAFMPLAVHGLLARYGEALTRRAAATPLVLGTAGHRFDRVFNALYFRAAELEPVPYSEVDAVLASGLALPVPLHARFTARDRPVVGTTAEYYALRGLRPTTGTPPLRLGEATLGARAAEELGLQPGDRVATDQRDLYDLTASYPLSLEVVGVFAPTGTPDDDAVFVDVKTTWAIAGIGHGHAAPERPGAMDPGVVTAQVVNDENRASFHAHGDPGAFPLTAIIVVPHDDKSATLLKARTNARPGLRMVSPALVVEELLGIVLKIKRFFDAHQVLTGLATLVFVVLIIGLSARMRRDELATLYQLGASRGFALRLQAAEWALMGGAALGLALLGVLALALALPDGVLP